MSEAFASTVRISFEVPGGMLVRQAHHWAVLLLPAALLLRLLYAFFTGELRRPRRLAWVALFGIFVAALLGGWSGYALPDDLLAGTGLRIFRGVLLGIPVLGTPVSMLIFGGEFPGDVRSQLYPIHVIIAPAALLLLGVARLRRGSRTPAPQFHGAGRSGGNVVGRPVWPTVAVRSFGMFMITTGLLLVMAGTAEIGPAWRQGPSSPAAAGAGSQLDWYTAFFDGALRLVPPGWEITACGHTWILAVLVPLAAISLFLVAIAGWPLIEQWLTGDRDKHQLQLSFESVIHAFQVILIVGPLAGFLGARGLCHELQRRELERVVDGAESGVLVRLPGGGYVERHSAVTPAERYVSASLEAVPARALSAGRRSRPGERAAELLSRRYLAGARRPHLESRSQPRHGTTHRSRAKR